MPILSQLCTSLQSLSIVQDFNSQLCKISKLPPFTIPLCQTSGICRILLVTYSGIKTNIFNKSSEIREKKKGESWWKAKIRSVVRASLSPPSYTWSPGHCNCPCKEECFPYWTANVRSCQYTLNDVLLNFVPAGPDQVSSILSARHLLMSQNWKFIVHLMNPALSSRRSSKYPNEFLLEDRAKQGGHLKFLHFLTHFVGRKIVRKNASCS